MPSLFAIDCRVYRTPWRGIYRQIVAPSGRTRVFLRPAVWCGSTQAKEQIGFLGAASSQEHLFSLSWDSPGDCQSRVKGSHFLNCSEARI